MIYNKLMDSKLLEKAEYLLTQYVGSYDLEIARLKVPAITDEEFEIMQNDLLFKTRLNLINAGLQERIITNLIELSDSDAEPIKLKATIELGRIMYKKKFDSKNNAIDVNVNNLPKVVLVGVDADGSRS